MAVFFKSSFYAFANEFDGNQEKAVKPHKKKSGKGKKHKKEEVEDDEEDKVSHIVDILLSF